MQAIIGKVTGGPTFAGKDDMDLSGRTAVITGGSLGIGFEIAYAFALAKARVIMVSQTEDHGTDAITKIQEAAKGAADVEWIHCDMGNLTEVKQVADSIREKEKRLDLLVCNAGVNANKFDLDQDGIDRHFGVNWLGHFLLINRLMPLMRTTSRMQATTVPAPRIVFVSSEMHRLAPSSTRFESLEEINDASIDPAQLYARTKLAMILGVKYGLVKKVFEPNADRMYALAVHPGAVNTAMQAQWKEAYGQLVGGLIEGVSVALSRSPEQGAVAALYAATSPEVEEKCWNGVYLSDPGKLGEETAQASDPQLGNNLWNLSTKLVTEKIGADALLPWDSTK